MNKAVIICVLSLSLCLIQATPATDEHPVAAANPPAAAAPKEALGADKNNATTIAATNTTAVPPSPTQNPAPVAPQKLDPNSNVQPNNTDSKTQDAKKDTTKLDNKTTPSAVPVPAKPENKTPEPAANKTVAPTETSPVKPTDASKNTTVKPTEAPKDVTEKPPLAARGFDGPSFIGGIILTLGLLAIGFMGLKYYKNQTERNYHTL